MDTIIAESHRKVDGSYFFGRGLGDREKASFFPATIAFQLSRSTTSCRNTIKNTIKTGPGIFSETFLSQFRQLLIVTAKKRWSFQSPITIVIDALDECDSGEDQVELLKLILEAVATTKMRFLIASQPEQQIHVFFQRKDVCQHTYHIRLDEESFNSSRDIEIFLRAEFRRIRVEKPESCPSLPDGEAWPGNTIIILIRDDSDSQFMYPRLCIDYIDTPDFSPDRQLRTLIAARPPHAFSKLDTLYHLVLSRRSPTLLQAGEEALRRHQEVIIGILQIIIAWPGGPFSAMNIARILHEEADIVHNIIRGPMRSLFKFKADDPHSAITLCHKSLRDYLLDRERSHEFFVPGDADGLFAQLLSRQPPSEVPSQPYSQEVLKGVLLVVVAMGDQVTVSQIVSALDVAPGFVEAVIFGPAKALFQLNSLGDVEFSTPSFKAFLLDGNRAGEYFIPNTQLDILFTRILSRQPPSDPLYSYSRDTLMSVLTVLVVFSWCLSVSQIASSLDVDPAVVEAIVCGPSHALFHLSSESDVTLSPMLEEFLHDASRAGDFYISLRHPNPYYDSLFAKIYKIRWGY